MGMDTIAVQNNAFRIDFGCTPLNDSLLTMHTYLPEFKSKNNVQIVNLIYLTDGDLLVVSMFGIPGLSLVKITLEILMRSMKKFVILNVDTLNRNNRTKTIIRDTKSKKEYTLDSTGAGRYSRNEMTNTLVEILDPMV